MGQYFILASIENGEYFDCGKGSEFDEGKEGGCLVDRLALPVKSSQLQPSSVPTHPEEAAVGQSSKRKPGPTVRSKSTFESIPNELVMRILHVLDLASCFRLSLVSQRFWTIGWPYTQQRVMERLGCWAGTKLVCLGDYHEREIMPSDFPTMANIAETALRANSVDAESLEDLLSELKEARCHYFVITDCYKKIMQDSWREKDLLESMTDEAQHLPKPLRSELLDFIFDDDVSAYYPDTESWVLRNLTSSEFVRGDALVAAIPRSDRGNGPDLGYPGFGDAIANRIFWSEDPASIPDDIDCHGVWAGHRFEICTEKAHVSKSDTGWKDVTKYVAKELKAVIRNF